MSNLLAKGSIEVDFPRGPSDGLILSFPEGLLKLPFQELRFDSLLLRTLPEVGLSLRRFPPKKLVGASQISGPPVTRRRRLMRKDPAQLGIYCQTRAAAGANQVHRRALVITHLGLKASLAEAEGRTASKGKRLTVPKHNQRSEGYIPMLRYSV